jgi:hypothetical protein
MKTLIKSNKLLTLVIVGVLLMATDAAVAINQERKLQRALVAEANEPVIMGRFVVTPTKSTFIAAPANVAKF